MRVKLAGFVVVLVLASACAPMFSDARMLRRGQVEVTPAVNPVFVTERGQTEHEWTDVGARAQFGISNRVDFGAGYIRSQVSDGDFGLNTVLFGPRFSLVPDRVAVALPVGFSFGEFGDELDVADTWQLNPTLLLTAPMGRHVDFNPAVRLMIPTCENCDTLIALHAGFGFRVGRHLVLRPEVAFIFNPGDNDGVLWTAGLGASFRTQ